MFFFFFNYLEILCIIHGPYTIRTQEGGVTEGVFSPLFLQIQFQDSLLKL